MPHVPRQPIDYGRPRPAPPPVNKPAPASAPAAKQTGAPFIGRLRMHAYSPDRDQLLRSLFGETVTDDPNTGELVLSQRPGQQPPGGSA